MEFLVACLYDLAREATKIIQEVYTTSTKSVGLQLNKRRPPHAID